MANLSLVLDILARDKASKEFDKVGRSVEDAGKKSSKLGSGLAGIGKVAGAAAIGGVAVLGAGLVSAFKGGLEEMNANQVAMAQFQAGVKQTGGVANVSAAEMQKLADSIEAKTGTDGAAVVSGGALLATFLKVRDEVGKGNDVFTRATQAGVDLAARGFGSVESNAVLLGKALNDPIKGLTALGKQGVTFTEQQKGTIKSLVETGDTLGAQKIILAEVEAQVGGSAEAYGKTLPGQTARARAALDGVKETLVKGTMPAFAGILSTLNDRLFPMLSDLASRFGPMVSNFFRDTLVPAFKQAASFVSENVIPVLRNLATFFVENVLPAIIKVAGGILGGLQDAFNNIRDKIKENRPQIDSLVTAFKAVAEFIYKNIIPLLGPVLGTAFRVLGEVIGVAIGVIGGIVKAFTAVRDTTVAVVRVVVDTFLGFVETLVTGAAKAFGWVPGIGGKLKTAAAEIAGFRDSTNRALAAINDKTIRVTTIQTTIQRYIVEGQRATGRGSTAGFASGVRNFGGGWAMVGELGPELTYLPPGSNVYSATDTDQMLRSGGPGGGNTYNVNTTATDPAQLVGLLKRMELLNA